jgi:hypothetical protein
MFLLAWYATALTCILSSIQARLTDEVGMSHVRRPFPSFLDVAKSGNPVSDKVTAHSYQIMYDMLLLPKIRKHRKNHSGVKLLEIGLGCDMEYGARRCFLGGRDIPHKALIITS